jgi:streptogramin lyase
VRFQSASCLTFCLTVPLVLSVAQGIDGRSAYATVEVATQKIESIPIPGTKAFPESITSTTDGTLYVGRVGDGGIVSVKPRTAESTIFIQPGASGSRSILGVFANSFLPIEGSGTLDRVVIQGDASVTQVHGGFATPTSVARIGTTAWVSEGQLT